MTISRLTLPRMRNISSKSCEEKENTHLVFNNRIPKIVPFYEIMSKNMMEPERPHTGLWRRVACWISKATRAQEQASAPAPTSTRTNAHAHRNMSDLLYFHSYNSFANAPLCYVTRTLPVLLLTHHVLVAALTLFSSSDTVHIYSVIGLLFVLKIRCFYAKYKTHCLKHMRLL
jgi:hypothetical protein